MLDCLLTFHKKTPIPQQVTDINYKLVEGKEETNKQDHKEEEIPLERTPPQQTATTTTEQTETQDINNNTPTVTAATGNDGKGDTENNNEDKQIATVAETRKNIQLTAKTTGNLLSLPILLPLILFLLHFQVTKCDSYIYY